MDQLLREYQISPAHGFLPEEEPHARLPRYYQAWDEIGWYLPDLLLSDQLPEAIQSLPHLTTDKLGHHLAYERAMLILSYVAHAYLVETSKNSIPATIAQPWYEIAKKLGRPPVIAHASAVLHNWQKLDPDKPVALNNLMICQRYKGSNDEAWFFLVTVAIEAQGAAIIQSILRLFTKQTQDIAYELQQIAEGLSQITDTLNLMPTKCDPHVFYTQLRPFLASLDGVLFEGVDKDPKSFTGGSAAQSSLIQAIDIVMGIKHPHEAHYSFLMQMRNYMPPQHRYFLEYLESLPTIPEIIPDKHQSMLVPIYSALENFRKAHFRIFQTYVGRQTVKSGPGDVGTGGTDAAKFLKDLLKDTKRPG